MKLVFLDIDGVLNRNHEEFIEGSCRHMGRTEHPLSRELIENLNYLTDYTGAKIVVSSSWRKGETVESMKELLESVGVTGEVVGITGSNPSGIRGIDIRNWISDNLGARHSEYEDYVILDDDSDMLLWQKDNFVNTKSTEGLTRGMMWKAINILGGK